jgi:hypothetical protein
VASHKVTLALPEELADHEEGYAAARDGMIRDMECGDDLGTGGQITWTQDSLHSRGQCCGSLEVRNPFAGPISG